jgi:hypothetical protein
MLKLPSLSLQKLLLLPSSLLLPLSELVLAQQACQFSPPLQYAIVHQQPVSINTDVLFNTTFFPIAGVGVTIDNAPTSLNGVRFLT